MGVCDISHAVDFKSPTIAGPTQFTVNWQRHNKTSKLRDLLDVGYWPHSACLYDAVALFKEGLSLAFLAHIQNVLREPENFFRGIGSNLIAK